MMSDLGHKQETIVARATPCGRGAIGVVRLSGPKSFVILKKVFRFYLPNHAFEPRRLSLGRIIDSKGRQIDQVLAVFMPGPNSYTGEDVVEIHCHGGELVVSAVITRLMEQGARPALPGEFTKRAFENKKIDLSRAEAVARLIDASSQAEVIGANRALEGELDKTSQKLKEEIIQVLASIEASIDFPDEADVKNASFVGFASLKEQCDQLSQRVHRICANGTYKVVLAGLPNVGKSSLLNTIAGKRASIVTNEPGTTRDAVFTELVVSGQRIHLVDTAGLACNKGAQNVSPILSQADKAAAQIAAEWVEKADLVLLIIDQIQNLDSLPLIKEKLVVFNKADLLSQKQLNAIRKKLKGAGGLIVSALTGQGVDELFKELEKRTQKMWGPSDGIPITVRQAQAIRELTNSLEEAREKLEAGLSELACEDLKNSLNAIGLLRGENVSTDVLDSIFSTFCIGK